MVPRTAKRLLVLVLTLFFTAQPFTTAAPPAVAAAHAQGFDRGVLWRVDCPGTKPSYLFGTLHSDDDRVISPPAAVRRAFKQSRVIAIEALTDEASARRFRAAMVSGEATLPTLLGEDSFARVNAQLREHGIPREAVPRLKTWAALLVLMQPLGTTAYTLDSVLAMQAREQGKPVVALETVEEQIDAFAGLPEDTQLAQLRQVQSQYEEIQAAVFPAIKAYLARDLAGLYRINSETMGNNPDMAIHDERLLERVLYERSARFAERLVSLLREGGVFAMFGALHLYGERGVPALLERQGFRLQRVY
jgi:uncharacterized protein